jgi:hypothetical protein
LSDVDSDAISDADYDEEEDASDREEQYPIEEVEDFDHPDEDNCPETYRDVDFVSEDDLGQEYTPAQKLANLLLCLSSFLVSESSVDGRPGSTLLVYFSGVLGFSVDGSTFRRPRNYTSDLPALIYCIRLLVLERALQDPLQATPGTFRVPRVINIDDLISCAARFSATGLRGRSGSSSVSEPIDEVFRDLRGRSSSFSGATMGRR